MLQCGSPMRSQALPANLLQHGLLCSQVLAGACSSEGLPTGSQLPSGIHLLWGGSIPCATGGYLLHHGPSQTAAEQPGSPRSSSRVAREVSLRRHFENLLPPPSSLTLMSAELLLSHSLTPVSSLPFHCRVFSSLS